MPDGRSHAFDVAERSPTASVTTDWRTSVGPTAGPGAMVGSGIERPRVHSRTQSVSDASKSETESVAIFTAASLSS
jgi:hypothetical protein